MLFFLPFSINNLNIRMWKEKLLKGTSWYCNIGIRLKCMTFHYFSMRVFFQNFWKNVTYAQIHVWQCCALIFHFPFFLFKKLPFYQISCIVIFIFYNHGMTPLSKIKITCRNSARIVLLSTEKNELGWQRCFTVRKLLHGEILTSGNTLNS